MTALDEYADDEVAALYDLQYDDWDDDLALYESFARRSETPSLELMAGSGRVALHLARSGCDVVAVDNAPHMLARLGARLDDATKPRVRIVEADVREFDLGEQFDLVFIALCSFELMHGAIDQLAVLDRVVRHLAPGGVFVAELRSLTAIDWGQNLRAAPRVASHGPRYRRVHYEAALGDVIAQPPDDARYIVFDRLRSDGSVHRRVLEVALRAFGRYRDRTAPRPPACASPTCTAHPTSRPTTTPAIA